MDIERCILKIIRGEKKAPVLKAFLAVLSFLYRFMVAFRNKAYDYRLLPATKLPVPVISIGNIAVGGTGKTPLVHMLALHLQDHMQLGILSRGFRSQMEESGRNVCISSGKGPLYGARECGDEPYFLAQKTKAHIWVGVNRTLSGLQAIHQGAQCLLLDDGMQHRKLRRDVEIVMIDGINPFSKGRFLPWGLLRDFPQRLKTANLIVATSIKDSAHFIQTQAELSSYTTAPVVGTQITVLNKECFIPRKVGVFCGIGQPARFLQTVRDLNQEIVDTFILNDHESPSQHALEAFAKKCLAVGAEALICTEKDAVKLPHDLTLCLEIIPVQIALNIAFGKEHWEHLIDRICHA